MKDHQFKIGARGDQASFIHVLINYPLFLSTHTKLKFRAAHRRVIAMQAGNNARDTFTDQLHDMGPALINQLHNFDVFKLNIYSVPESQPSLITT